MMNYIRSKHHFDHENLQDYSIHYDCNDIPFLPPSIRRFDYVPRNAI